MRFYPYYEQKDNSEIADLVRTTPYCQLLTAADGIPHVGIFNHVYLDNTFYLHLQVDDEQLADLTHTPVATLLFHEFLGLVPSYWVDRQYGGAATSYYRYAEFRGEALVHHDAPSKLKVLEKMMNKFQPEKKFTPLDPESKLYKGSFKEIAIVELRPSFRRAKWKVGQNRPVETRLKVAAEFEKRNKGNDLRAAAEIRKWIERTESLAKD